MTLDSFPNVVCLKQIPICLLAEEPLKLQSRDRAAQRGLSIQYINENVHSIFLLFYFCFCIACIEELVV